MDTPNPYRHLDNVARRRTVVEDLQRIWSRRHFLWFSAVSEMRVAEVDSVLGNLWHVLNPVLQMLIYYVVFGVLLKTSKGVDNLIPFLAIGVFSFSYMRRTVMGGAKSLVKNRGLIQSISFPVGTLPIAEAISEAVTFAGPATVMLIVAIAFGDLPTLGWLLIFPIFILQSMFALGLGFAAARFTYYIRDFENVLGFLFSMIFYFSSVIYLVDRFVTSPTTKQLADLNPFLDYLALQRWAIQGTAVTRIEVIGCFAWAFGALILGYLFFRARETEYGRDR